MKTSNNAKTNLFDHSKAKVSLYSQYLSVYLNILSRATGIDAVYIFDLMCGEGVYEDEERGSAIAALEEIRNFCNSNTELTTPIEIWLNDPSQSEIEPEMKKIERVRLYSEKIVMPDRVKIKYFDRNIDELYPEVLKIIISNKKSRSLVFIDPHGYRNTKPQQIRALLECGNSEVLLFMPASFLYRFISIAEDPTFAASEALRNLVFELYSQKPPPFSSVEGFIEGLKEKFQSYLSDLNIYVDTFTIERDPTNLYCLYFFTSNFRGFQKMLEVKWKLDHQRGKGFRLDKTGDLFSVVEVNQYPEKLLDYLKSKPYCTNIELRLFGYKRGYLPKHTKEALEALCNNGIHLEISSLDNKPLDRKTYHLNSEDRLISISIKS
jgi:three-Cys-motif partner protein